MHDYMATPANGLLKATELNPILKYGTTRALVKGNDPQLIKAVDEAMKLIQSKPRKLYPRPPFEDRTVTGRKDAF